MNEETRRFHAANLFSEVRQLHYSTKNEKSLDLVLFLNGIPIFSAELKNPLTGQTVEQAIRQYQSDRDPREPLLGYGRCLAHFAVDPALVYVSTQLTGPRTRFLPFNQGEFGGAGNPPVPPTRSGYATGYLWGEPGRATACSTSYASLSTRSRKIGQWQRQGPAVQEFSELLDLLASRRQRTPLQQLHRLRRQVQDCFCVHNNGSCGCPDSCRQCRYFQEMFAARFRFIHQIDFPAAVFKGLSLWGGNVGWAELCGMPEESLIGLGVETFIDPSSLATVISVFKKTALGENMGLIPSPVVIATPRQEKRSVSAWVFPLRDPQGAKLMRAGDVGPVRDGEPTNPR